MKESSTYQPLWNEGWREGFKLGFAEGWRQGTLAEARKVLRMWGDARFGAFDLHTAAAIELIEDLPQLEDLIARLNATKSWQELLGRPLTNRRSKRKPSP